jgi:Holliday junction resolvase
VLRDLQERGFYCVRSAGSKGAVDILALARGQVLLVQAKVSGKFPPAERTELVRLADTLDAVPVLVDRADARKLTYRRVYAEAKADVFEPTVSEDVQMAALRGK